MKVHYVYKITHVETNEFYIGSRTCNCNPELDIDYLGSMKTWKPDKAKLIKEILKSDFKTRNEANIFESDLIKSQISDKLNKNYNIPSDHTSGSFYQLYDNGIDILFKLKPVQLKVFISLFRYTNNNNRLVLSKFIKSDIATKNSMCLSAVNNSLTVLVKIGILFRLGRATYRINPEYFWKSTIDKRKTFMGDN